ncbi:MAG TPA: hypothetical protein VN935_09980 [Rhizomicrobium sp.]|jgi:hypothetical protein|nr:hypothetical protein [Rhizomicrobium sp.]
MHKRLFLFVAIFLDVAGAAASAQTLPDSNLVLVPFHASDIYSTGERAGWNIHALLGAGYTRYSYELSENNLKVIQSGEIDLSSGLGTVSTTLDHPGMLHLRLHYIGVPAPATPPAHKNWTR